MPTNDEMTRKRAKLVQSTTTKVDGYVTSNVCELGFRDIDILPEARKRLRYFAVATLQWPWNISRSSLPMH